MSNPVAERRAELARVFSSRRCELPRLEHTRLRFSHGTSLAELKVPFHPGAETARIFTAGARQLALMLVSGHRDLIATDEFDRFLVSDELGAIPDAPRTLAPSSGGPEVRAAAELGLRLHPALWGGVMAAWLGPGGGGRSLVALVIELLRKAFAEMHSSRGREETPSLVALMMGSLLPSAEAAIRGAGIPASVDRSLRGAAGAGFFLALRLGVERALREAKAPPDLAMRVEAPLSPATLLGGRAGLTGGLALYGLELSAGVTLVDETMARLSAGADAKTTEESIAKAVGSDEGFARCAEREVALAGLRERFTCFTLWGEQRLLAPALADRSRALSTQPGRLAGLLCDEKERKELSKELLKLGEKQADPVQVALCELGAALKAYKEKDPAACVGSSRAAAHAAYARACFVALGDQWLERALAPARRALDLRSGSESEGGLDAEYAAGHLYRLSAAEGPLLKSTTSAPVAHLFVDVKDFTRRTSLLGQAAIAEFLRREFYVPILASAKGHYGGMAHLSDRGGVSVNNLLGDALSMSGGIEALVALALDIRRHLASYERQLARSVSGDEVARAVKGIEEEHARKLRAARPGASPAQLEAERDAALARARGEGLEAGVFVSFGPAPLVLNLEDEIFGRQRVAIADRINESARGTARSTGARARADAQLAAERQRRGDKALAHPWAVFVGAPFTISIPVANEEAARAAARAGDLPAAMRAVAEPVKRAVEEAARTDERPGDIYNAGAALSEEALLAFQEAMGDRRIFKQLEVAPGSLDPELHRRYFFPPAPLRLVASFHPDGRLGELFRFAGRVLFKGLERAGGIGVWEIVGETGAGALIATHHGIEWFRR